MSMQAHRLGVALPLCEYLLGGLALGRPVCITHGAGRED
jgi:hypothetical protein